VESGENIGETSQALTHRTVLPDSKVRSFAASCVIGNKILVVGGFDAVGTGSRDAFLFDPAGNSGAGTWTDVEDLPENEGRGDARMIALPGVSEDGDDDRCLLVGGRATLAGTTAVPTGTVRSNAYYYDLSADDWVAAGTLPRAEFKMSVCGTGAGFASASTPAKVIVVGGTDGSDVQDNIKVYNANGNSWSNLIASQDRLKRQFPGLAAARGSNNTKFLVVGGKDENGPMTKAEVLSLTTGCAVSANNESDDTIGAQYMGEAFPYSDSNDDSFVFAAGTDANPNEGDAISTASKIVVDNWATGTITITGLTALTSPRIRPSVSSLGADKFVLVGGIDDSALTINSYQVWDGTAVTPAWETEVSMTISAATNPLVGAAVEWVPSQSKAYVIGGRKVTAGPTIATVGTTIEIP
jgi:hypothetical protein